MQEWVDPPTVEPGLHWCTPVDIQKRQSSTLVASAETGGGASSLARPLSIFKSELLLYGCFGYVANVRQTFVNSAAKSTVVSWLTARNP